MHRVGSPLSDRLHAVADLVLAERARLRSSAGPAGPAPEEAPQLTQTSVADFYAGRHVLVTGGSGFLGRLLVELLLRTCPDIGNVYLVLRAKRGQDPQQRLPGLLDVPLFDRLRREQPAALSKVVALRGDVTVVGLGLSVGDRQLLQQQVSVVFHGAASVRFDDSVKKAVLTNVLSTREVVDLAKGMPQLKAFVHVSTAYAFSNEDPIAEQVYRTDYDWKTILKAVMTMQNSKELDWLGSKVLGSQPNTYTFTKALAEQVIADASTDIPVIIARPSIVVGTLDDPIPGWTDNLNGLGGFWAAANKGVLRVYYNSAEDFTFDIIPADIAVKSILLSSWFTGMGCKLSSNSSGPDVINIVSGPDLGLTYSEMGWSLGKDAKIIQEVPFPNPLRFPRVVLTSSWLVHSIIHLFSHLLFAGIVDMACKAVGVKPRLLAIYRKVVTSSAAVLPFRRQFHFVGKNQWLLQVFVPPHEEKNFCAIEFLYTRDSKEKITQRFMEGIRGILLYALKEEIKPESWKYMKRLRWAEFFVKRATILLSLLVIWRILTPNLMNFMIQFKNEN